MAFEEDRAQCLQSAGINVGADVIPPQDAVTAALSRLQGWLDSLDANTKTILDQVSAGFAVKQGLADQSVGIAPELDALLSACDQLPESLSISAFVNQLNSCMRNIGS